MSPAPMTVVRWIRRRGEVKGTEEMARANQLIWGFVGSTFIYALALFVVFLPTFTIAILWRVVFCVGLSSFYGAIVGLMMARRVPKGLSVAEGMPPDSQWRRLQVRSLYVTTTAFVLSLPLWHWKLSAPALGVSISAGTLIIIALWWAVCAREMSNGPGKSE